MIRTQIGSLPHLSFQEAIQISFKHSLPFIPELVKKDENDYMLNRFSKMNKGIIPSLIVEDHFIDSLKTYSGSEFKLQLPGPISCAQFINENINWSNIINSAIEWLKKFELNKKIILFLDEPNFLVKGSQESEYKDFLLKIQDSSTNIELGFHSCHPDIDLDLSSYDLKYYSVHPSQTGNLASNDQILQSILDPIGSELQIVELNNLWGIAPLCGLGSLSIEKANKIIHEILIWSQ